MEHTWFYTLIAALVLDQILGEVKKYHPLIGFGRLASFLEQKLNRYSTSSDTSNKLAGIFASCLALLIVILAFSIPYSMFSTELQVMLDIVVLYFVIGRRSLVEHAIAIEQPLSVNEIAEARQKVGYIVSRDTQQMDTQQIASATVESVLENGNDSLFGAVFWFCVLGPIGALIFRCINTLDAMWGYRTERFENFGWFAARSDDLLNWLPARLTAISYAISSALLGLGNMFHAFSCWREQAHKCESPNGGVVMTAGAGALGIRLGGTAIYHGQEKEKPIIGLGNPAATEHISQSVKLVNASVFVWVICLTLVWITI